MTSTLRYNAGFCGSNIFVSLNNIAPETFFRPQIKYVSQETESGCAIACLAMLMGIKYWAAFDLMKKEFPGILDRPNTKDRHGYEVWSGPNHSAGILDIAKVLKKNGFVLTKIPSKTKINPKTPHPIVWSSQNSPGVPCTAYHCTIVCDGKVYDPACGVQEVYSTHHRITSFERDGSREPALLVKRKS